jgi:hypothetical protein
MAPPEVLDDWDVEPCLVQRSGSQFKSSTFSVRRSADWKIEIFLTGERRT